MKENKENKRKTRNRYSPGIYNSDFRLISQICLLRIYICRATHYLSILVRYGFAGKDLRGNGKAMYMTNYLII